ncbi:alpha/beta hydrolase family protein [Solwaraspora sp. WMMB335]|uniref:alpha/beta hydrolase family protein n=1 Tax=Solwaraspora sp. WMMB335 TaxID=3404118 RepID=UPI003B94F2F0
MPTSYRSLAFDDPSFEFSLHRVLGYAPFGAAAVGECLQAAAAIEDGSLASWSAAWDAAADAVRTRADAALAAGHRATARHAYLRAHNYARAAAVSRVHDDPAHLRSWRHAVDSFAQAGALRSPQVQPLEIPYGRTALPGWFFPAADDGRARPTLVAMGGGDASGEESWFHCGADDAARRGYNVVTFHGPGQRGALHRDAALVWRPDYEVVLSAVVDAIVERPDVDPDRVAIYGVSLGGWAVLRAAATDHRLAAVVANSPVLDFHAVTSAPPPTPPSGGQPAPSAEKLAYHLDLLRWTYGNGVENRQQWLDLIRDFRADHLVADIKCPVLALSSDGEPPSVHPQVERFVETCPAPVTAIRFTAADGADAHVQFNNVQLVTDTVYDWLDDTLGTAPARAS